MMNENFDPNKVSEVIMYSVQGGGYATTTEDGQYVWLTAIPDSIDAKVGEPIPTGLAIVYMSGSVVPMLP